MEYTESYDAFLPKSVWDFNVRLSENALKGKSMFEIFLNVWVVRSDASRTQETYMGQTYSNLGQIRCIGGTQIPVQTCHTCPIRISLNFALDFVFFGPIIIINYLLHVCLLICGLTSICGVFSTGVWALFEPGNCRC